MDSDDSNRLRYATLPSLARQYCQYQDALGDAAQDPRAVLSSICGSGTVTWFAGACAYVYNSR